jgi:hypothetical protein
MLVVSDVRDMRGIMAFSSFLVTECRRTAPASNGDPGSFLRRRLRVPQPLRWGGAVPVFYGSMGEGLRSGGTKYDILVS